MQLMRLADVMATDRDRIFAYSRSRALLVAVSGMVEDAPETTRTDDPSERELRRRLAAKRGELTALYSAWLNPSDARRARFTQAQWRDALRKREA